MALFDLGRFRDLAFGRETLPDHPMSDVAEAKKLLALLPEDDPDTAARPLWRAQAARYLRPGLLRALNECATK